MAIDMRSTYGSAGFVNINRVMSPSTQIFMADSYTSGSNDRNYGFAGAPENCTGWRYIDQVNSEGKVWGWILHNDKCNMLFMDGHSQTLGKDSLTRSMCDFTDYKVAKYD